jgi:hypothetical protein
MDQEPVVDTTTDGKGRPRMLYEEPLKDRSLRRDIRHSRNAIMALERPKTAAMTVKQGKCKVNKGL